MGEAVDGSRDTGLNTLNLGKRTLLSADPIDSQ